MKKRYFAPIADRLEVVAEGLIATSGGLDNGDNVGNQKPKDDNDENFFSNNRSSSIWD